MTAAPHFELTRLFRIKFFVGRSYPLLLCNPGVAWEDQVLASNSTIQHHFLHVPVRSGTTPIVADTQLLYLQESSGAVTIKPLLVFKPRCRRLSFLSFLFCFVFFYSFCCYECFVVNRLDERGREASCSISRQIPFPCHLLKLPLPTPLHKVRLLTFNTL